MHHCCDKTNQIAISFPWCQVPSPAVNLLSHFSANRISIHMAGQWWTVITITAIGLVPLISRMNPSQHSRTGSHCQLIKVVRANLFAIPGCDEDSQLLDLQSTNNSEGDGPGWWKEHGTWSQGSQCAGPALPLSIETFSFWDSHFPHLPISSSAKSGGWPLCWQRPLPALTQCDSKFYFSLDMWHRNGKWQRWQQCHILRAFSVLSIVQAFHMYRWRNWG